MSLVLLQVMAPKICTSSTKQNNFDKHVNATELKTDDESEFIIQTRKVLGVIKRSSASANVVENPQEPVYFTFPFKGFAYNIQHFLFCSEVPKIWKQSGIILFRKLQIQN